MATPQMSSDATQKLGAACPANAVAVTIMSVLEYCLTAEITPSGMEIA